MLAFAINYENFCLLLCTTLHWVYPLPPPSLFLSILSHPEAEETHKARPALCLTPGESCPAYEAGFVWVSSLYLSDFEFVMRF